MIQFLLKGVLRDHHRSFFPVIIVSIGVALTVIAHAWVSGIFGDMIEFNAKFNTGHVRIMTKGYADNIDQVPNDYALENVDELISQLHNDFPKLSWAKRIKFGGLIDIPDENGETKIQGPAIGLALDLLTKESREIDRLNLQKSLKKGQFPSRPGEILLSDAFAQKLKIQPGETATIITSTMYGSMAISNFIMSGTIEFGVRAMDKGAVIMDISDAQNLLDMTNATGEILGYLPDNYNQDKASQIKNNFNAAYHEPENILSPLMQDVRDEEFLGEYLAMAESMSGTMIFIFLLIMSIVLWNSGLLGALRRYGEVGVRLAIGENKTHIYISLIIESLAVGVIGSIAGTGIGLFVASLLEKGIDVGAMMQNSTVMMQSVFRGHISSATYYIGFFPGILSTILGTMLSGIGIYKRQTAQLFKELEA